MEINPTPAELVTILTTGLFVVGLVFFKIRSFNKTLKSSNQEVNNL